MTPFYIFLSFTLSSCLNGHAGSAVCVPLGVPGTPPPPSVPLPTHTLGFPGGNLSILRFQTPLGLAFGNGSLPGSAGISWHPLSLNSSAGETQPCRVALRSTGPDESSNGS